MYSRKLGISDEPQNAGGIEKFNQSLREQYLKKRKNITPTMLTQEQTTPTAASEKKSLDSLIKTAESGLTGLNIDMDFDILLIAGLIVVLLAGSETPDLILLGALASILF